MSDRRALGAPARVEVLRSRYLSCIPGLRHGFFTRHGGVSVAPYASLNCGPDSRDDAASVAENRRTVCEALGVAPAALCSARQAHTTITLRVTAPFGEQRPTADALVTLVPAVALAALGADCAPVLIADRRGRIVAAVHAGWKGALGGVTDAAVRAMRSLGCEPAELSACIGPCIQQASYQVGSEFLDRFLRADPDSARYFCPDRGSRHRFDLPGYVEHRLRAVGVQRVERLAEDTCADSERFFSYRRSCLRGESDYGRQIALIAPAP